MILRVFVSVPPASPSRHIREAARRIKIMLLLASGGRLPRSIKRWHQLCESLGIPVTALGACPDAFTAGLFYDERLRDGWMISYNPQFSARQVCRFICHELSEWLAICDYPSLFDGMPDRVYFYAGGNDPDDARHRIARRVEKLCFRRSE